MTHSYKKEKGKGKKGGRTRTKKRIWRINPGPGVPERRKTGFRWGVSGWHSQALAKEIENQAIVCPTSARSELSYQQRHYYAQGTDDNQQSGLICVR